MNSWEHHRLDCDCPHCDGKTPPRFYLAPVIATDRHWAFALACVQLAFVCLGFTMVAILGWVFRGVARATAAALVVLGEVLWAIRAKRASCAVVDVAARIRRRVG